MTVRPEAETPVIDIAKQFTRFPAGRFRSDGAYSGERFRDDILIPALQQYGRVSIKLDGTMGYGSSFLEEVFGGLIRSGEFKSDDLLTKINLESRDSSLISEIKDYLCSSHH
jgi:hypothetical protein